MKNGSKPKLNPGSVSNTGLLIGGGKKVTFCRILKDKFAEKSANFAGSLMGNFGANFSEKQLVKNDRFCGNFQGKFC